MNPSISPPPLCVELRRCDVLAESSTRRGAGLAVKARCPLHVNITAALLDTLSDMQQQMARLFAELDAVNFRRRVEVVRATQTAPGTDGAEGADSLANQSTSATGGKGKKNAVDGEGGRERVASGREDDQISRYRHREVVQYNDFFSVAWPTGGHVDRSMSSGSHQPSGGGRGRAAAALDVNNTGQFPVCHEFSAPLPLESRMSFTILNLTGQRTRYFQPRAREETRRLQYLRVRKMVAYHVV